MAFGLAKQIVNVMPGLGRDRISLLRLWLSYKITASKAIDRCPVVIGMFVPHIRILITRVSLHAAYPKTMLPNLSIV